MAEWMKLCAFCCQKEKVNILIMSDVRYCDKTVHVNIFVRSQTAINLFENTCEDILNLSKAAGNKNNNLPAIQ